MNEVQKIVTSVITLVIVAGIILMSSCTKTPLSMIGLEPPSAVEESVKDKAKQAKEKTPNELIRDQLGR